jgi:apolipoprotein N-acyltransferase
MPRLRVNAASRRIPRTKAPHGGLALLSGALLSFAFPEADIAPLAWIGLAPLLVLLSYSGARAGFGLGLLFGIGFYGALLIWTSIVGWVGWVALVLTQALFTGLYGALYGAICGRMRGAWRIVMAPILWVAVDFLRANFPVGGFTWGQLAQSQHNLDWMLTPAAFGGAWLVTFIVVTVNALLASMWEMRRSLSVAVGVAAAAACALLLAGPLLLPSSSASGASVRVAIAQGNVPRDWNGTSFDKELQILSNHIDVTQQLGDEDVDLVVWPESSVGIDLTQVPQVAEGIAAAARAVERPMIIGGNLDAGPGHYKVMAFEVAPDGNITDRYQKTHLVPFGEYVPARRFLDWIPMLDQVPRDAIPAAEPVVFEVAGGSVAPVISFEGDFGSLVRARIGRGGRLLVVATNTSTWEESWASAQHLAFSQVRAVENGVWVVHAAISGISAFVSPDGRVTQRTPLWVKTSLVEDVRFAENITPYARIGDWLPYLCVAAVSATMAFAVTSGHSRAAGETA